MDTKAPYVGRLPGLGGHLLARGVEPVDFLRLVAVQRLAMEKPPAMERRLLVVDRDEPAYERQQLLLVLIQFPIEPRDLVVLAVSVVVAALAVADFVARQEHRNSLRDNQRREKGPLLVLTQGANFRIIGRTLGAAVPTVVIVRAVAILLSIGFIVLLIVRDKIGERETVVTRNEVHAGVRSTAVPLVQVARAADARGEFRGFAAVALPKAAHRVAKFAVP